MTDVLTDVLQMRLREIGSRLPHKYNNNWGNKLNEELNRIDWAVKAYCTEEQIELIRDSIHWDPKDGTGIVLGHEFPVKQVNASPND